MTLVSNRYRRAKYPCACKGDCTHAIDPWLALSRWDRFVFRKRRKLGLVPYIVIHQGEYVITRWLVPTWVDEKTKWMTLDESH